MSTQVALLEIVDTDWHSLLMPADADKHTRYRLAKFSDWLTTQGQPWHKPNLAAYRDHLLDGHAPRTVQAHLSTIRGCYARLVKDNATRDTLYAVAARVTDSPAERKAFVDETLTRIENAIAPKRATVKVKVSQDRADADQLRLTAEQASALMAAPSLKDLVGLRDTAVIALMLCTGIREAELSALDVGDLRQRLGGELALHVREGKGCKERLVPYGELSWVLAIVDRWLAGAGVEGGAVFRGIHKGGERLRPGRLSVRAIQYILAHYPVMVDGDLITVKPHDCRRTYARRLYEAGVDLVAIQQNLGHADVKTTLGYIGTLDASRRRAPAIYSFDLAKLAEVPVQAKIELVSH
ncbi:MAG: tyrosine-type recombinase/integrase [Anaerolineae bacterium]|nr:tyrosine-type recombinase/integrase [Anaerolineae bacterium]